MLRFNKNHRRKRNVGWSSQNTGCRLETPKDRLPQQHVCKEEEDFDDHQLCNQERNTRMDGENPEQLQIKLEEEELYCSHEGQLLIVKQETDTSLLTPIYLEEDHRVDPSLSAEQNESVINMPVISSVVGAPNSDLLLSYKPHIAENQDQKDDIHEDSGSTREAETNPDTQQHKRRRHSDDGYKRTMLKTSIIIGKEKMDPRRRLLDITLRPELKLHRIELQQQYVCKTEEEVLTDHQIFNQEMNSSIKQEEPELLHIKEEQVEFYTSPEVEQHVVKQETDTFMWNFAENEHSDYQTPYLNENETLSTEEKESEVNMVIIGSVVEGPNGEALLLSDNSGLVESQDHEGDKDLSFKANIHMKKNTDGSPYVCQTCNQDFRFNGHLKRHMRIHEGEKPHVCKTCGKGFRRNSTMKHHMRIHTGEKPYVCKTCGKDFRQISTLKQHMRAHTGERPYICKTCGKGFRQNNTLKRHMRIHTGEKPYVCKTCGKDFRRNCHLITHMTTHTGERPFVCKTCGSGFKYMRTLKIHMTIHTDEKPYVCETCENGFSPNGEVTSHVSIPTGEKPFVCKTCGKGFKRKSYLTKHMGIHSYERPCICKICGNDFVQDFPL